MKRYIQPVTCCSWMESIMTICSLSGTPDPTDVVGFGSGQVESGTQGL